VDFPSLIHVHIDYHSRSCRRRAPHHNSNLTQVKIKTIVELVARSKDAFFLSELDNLNVNYFVSVSLMLFLIFNCWVHC